MTPLESENWVNLIQNFFKNSKVCLDKSGQGPVFFETSPILIMGAFLAAATAATVLKLACAWRSECDIEGVDVQVWEGRSWRSCVQRWNWIRHCFFAISISSQLLKCFRIYFEIVIFRSSNDSQEWGSSKFASTNEVRSFSETLFFKGQQSLVIKMAPISFSSTPWPFFPVDDHTLILSYE